MSEAAAHLVEQVLPHVPYRQFVITFPYPLRYMIHTNRKLFSAIHDIITKQIQAHLRPRAGVPETESPQAGTVSFTQRWGSAFNLNPHIHLIASDGVHYRPHQPLFRKAKKLRDDDVTTLLMRITADILQHLQRVGILDIDGEIVENPLRDSPFIVP